MKQINWDIIGCGDVTEKKSGPAFSMVPGSALLAVMRRTPGLAADYARRHGVPRWYSCADDLIHDPEVNAIYVATPPSSHLEYAVKAMRAGKPVYVEKPMAASFGDCVTMVKESEKTGIPLFVAYYRPFMPYFRKVKELLSAGKTGIVRHINIRLHSQPRPVDLSDGNLPWRVQPEIAGGGYFYDMAPHQLNLLIHLFGVPELVSGISHRRKKIYPAEDGVTASLVFPGNIPCFGSWNFVAEPHEEADYIEILGSSGKLTFSTFGFTPVELCNEEGCEEFPVEKNETVQFQLIREVVRALLEERPMLHLLTEAVETNRILDIILGKNRLK
ncbi:MAG: Gfo/Idh/MocA family oxidoreductase [Bacteroidales bacterium]